jgi:hypothetical protein
MLAFESGFHLPMLMMLSCLDQPSIDDDTCMDCWYTAYEKI